MVQELQKKPAIKLKPVQNVFFTALAKKVLLLKREQPNRLNSLITKVLQGLFPVLTGQHHYHAYYLFSSIEFIYLNGEALTNTLKIIICVSNFN